MGVWVCQHIRAVCVCVCLCVHVCCRGSRSVDRGSQSRLGQEGQADTYWQPKARSTSLILPAAAAVSYLPFPPKPCMCPAPPPHLVALPAPRGPAVHCCRSIAECCCCCCIIAGRCLFPYFPLCPRLPPLPCSPRAPPPAWPPASPQASPRVCAPPPFPFPPPGCTSSTMPPCSTRTSSCCSPRS